MEHKEFKDKYSIKDEIGKTKITPEAYAIGDMIEELISKVNQILILK